VIKDNVKTPRQIFLLKILPEAVDSKMLYYTFSVFGPILDCKVMMDHIGTSRGYGYVHFVEEEHAKKAIEGVDKLMIMDKQLHVEAFIPRPQRVDNIKWTNVYVKNIPAKMDIEQLKKLAEEKTGGKIDSMREWSRPMFGKSACLNFETHEQAEACVNALNNYELKEWVEEKENDTNVPKLYVTPDQKHWQRDDMLENPDSHGRGRQLYVNPLALDMTDDNLYEIFLPFGEITSAQVVTNEDTGESLGFGFVSFKREEDASMALMNSNGSLIDGTKLCVARVQLKAERQEYFDSIQASPRQQQIGGIPLTNYIQLTQPVVDPLLTQLELELELELDSSVSQPELEPGASISRPIHSFPLQTSATERKVQPLTPQMLQNASAQERKRMIGERLFPKIQEIEPPLAGKITGMLLEMENTDLLVLLSNKAQLRKKINEALSVLKKHNKKQSLRNSELQALPRQQIGGSLPANYSQLTLDVGDGQMELEPGATVSRPKHSFPSQLSATEREKQPLTLLMLQKANGQERKRMIGERLFPKIQEVEPRLAGKITGIL